jgi:hypothetical protein
MIPEIELSKIVTVSFGGSTFQKTKDILKSVFVVRSECCLFLYYKIIIPLILDSYRNLQIKSFFLINVHLRDGLYSDRRNQSEMNPLNPITCK